MNDSNGNMKFYLSILGLLALVIGTICLIIGCGIGDDEFSDTKVLEQIIRKDLQDVFGTNVANDENSAPEDTTILKAGFSKEYSDFSSAAVINFGRIIRPDDRDKIDSLRVSLISDSQAFAFVRYQLVGYFRVVFPDGDGFEKPLSHKINRFMTFIKRENPDTEEPWSRVSVSGGFGYAENSKLKLDSLIIITPSDTITATEPLDVILLERKHVVLHRGDPISITVVARNSSLAADTLFGNIVMGKNRERDGRSRLRLPYTGNNRYQRTVLVGTLQPSGFNQLMIDFISRGTLLTRVAPYDSFILLIPYRIVD